MNIVEVLKIIEAKIAEATAGPKLEGSDYLAKTNLSDEDEGVAQLKATIDKEFGLLPENNIKNVTEKD